MAAWPRLAMQVCSSQDIQVELRETIKSFGRPCAAKPKHGFHTQIAYLIKPRSQKEASSVAMVAPDDP